MAQWKNTDNAANTVIWAARSIGAGSGKAAQAANNTALFGNTTTSAFIPNQKIGLFGADVTEAQAGSIGSAHSGHILRREGTGGRAGRVTFETLVAMGTLTGDADGVTIPNYVLSFSVQPANKSANSSNSDVANFSVTVLSQPTGATFSYKWQANTGAGFADINNGAVYGNTTTANVAVINTTGLTGAQFRVQVGATGAVNVFSASANLTVTT